MTELVDPTEIELIVGAPRHPDQWGDGPERWPDGGLVMELLDAPWADR